MNKVSVLRDINILLFQEYICEKLLNYASGSVASNLQGDYHNFPHRKRFFDSIVLSGSLTNRNRMPGHWTLYHVLNLLIRSARKNIHQLISDQNLWSEFQSNRRVFNELDKWLIKTLLNHPFYSRMTVPWYRYITVYKQRSEI